ncbi:MAG: HNH endonuclease [Smithella sp.]
MATQFKKGNKPANWVPIGTERTNRDGYVEVKIADGRLNKNWKAKHIFIWETANGPVPKGHVVIFGDGKTCR